MINISKRLAPLMLAVAAACSFTGGASSSPAPKIQAQPPIVYAAVGASDSIGIGATDALQDAWPQVFYRAWLPESAVMYNFGIPGATVATALDEEVPEALSVQPTLVTVWLNVDDLIAGVGASDYAAELGQLVHQLRRGGAARVLIANTPYLDRLPAYLDCRAGNPPAGITCPPALAKTSPELLDADVNAYNAAIARIAETEGATLVDLHSQGEVPDLHPEYVSKDGFHPSTRGYAAIAAAFAAAFRQS